MSLLFHSRFASVKKCIDRRICNVLLCVHVVTEDAGPVCLCVYISVRVCVCVLDSFYLCFHLLAFIWLTERKEERCLSAPNPVTRCDVICYDPHSVCACICVCVLYALYVSLNLGLMSSLPSVTCLSAVYVGGVLPPSLTPPEHLATVSLVLAGSLRHQSAR